MPDVFPINALGFEDLIDEMGLQVSPRAPFWWLSDTIIPVSLVNSQVSLTSVDTPRVETVSTNGPQTNPGAGATLADTGQLAAGSHRFRIYFSDEAGVLQDFRVEHRNAGNTANIFEHRVSANAAGFNYYVDFNLTIAQNERVRVQVGAAGAAGRETQATIFHFNFS